MAYQSNRRDSNHYYAYSEAKREGVNFDKSPFELTSKEKNILLDIADDIGYKKSTRSANNLSRVGAFYQFLKKKYHKK